MDPLQNGLIYDSYEFIKARQLRLLLWEAHRLHPQERRGRRKQGERAQEYHPLLQAGLLIQYQLSQEISLPARNYAATQLVKDIFENSKSEYYEKLVDEYLAFKLQAIVTNIVEGKSRDSRNGSTSGMS